MEELGKCPIEWLAYSPVFCISHPALVLFVLSWQNQLLAKGLSFVEEKIKLCEGKYEAALVHGALTQPLVFAGLSHICPKAADSQRVSHSCLLLPSVV